MHLPLRQVTITFLCSFVCTTFIARWWGHDPRNLCIWCMVERRWVTADTVMNLSLSSRKLLKVAVRDLWNYGIYLSSSMRQLRVGACNRKWELKGGKTNIKLLDLMFQIWGLGIRVCKGCIFMVAEARTHIHTQTCTSILVTTISDIMHSLPPYHI